MHFGVSGLPRSAACVIVSLRSDALRVDEFASMAEADSQWFMDVWLYAAVMFLQRPDSSWAPWRTYGFPSSVARIRSEFADEGTRNRLLSDALRSVPTVARPANDTPDLVATARVEAGEPSLATAIPIDAHTGPVAAIPHDGRDAYATPVARPA